MKYKLGIISTIFVLLGCGSSEPLPVVEDVELDRYAGLWYEISRLPNSFQENCTCTTAQYAVKDGYVSVLNSCWNTSKERMIDIKGKAFPVKGTNNASLKVQFFWPFKGDYNIIALDSEYQYALVGSKNRKYLWILSRNPQLSDDVYQSMIMKAENLGYETDDLIRTEHPCPK